MYSRVLLLDGYVDEPSTLGVPPYCSPYSRYIYGLLLDTGLKEEAITYLTIDEARKMERPIEDLSYPLVIILAGTTVPGHYLGGRPISIQEIRNLLPQIKEEAILVGPINECSLTIPGILQAPEQFLTFLYGLLTGEEFSGSYVEGVARWSILGAPLTRRHPSYPYLVCELETYRGCLRENNCRFCSERLKKSTYRRRVEDVIREVSALYQEGNHYFRLGSQPDLILYGAKRRAGLYPLPHPPTLKELYEGIREVAPDLKVLHMDNGGPRSLVGEPSLGQEILEIITENNTPGDVVAMGLESADPKVLEANSIGASIEETKEAIRMVNKIGGARREGLPLLLPGLNLLHGLHGESKKTRELNYQFLKTILDEGLLLRRINIRQVRSISSYQGEKVMSQYRFQEYKEKINQEINRPMLREVFPLGTILKDVLVESAKGLISFGRPLGSYPILVGIPGAHPKGEILTVSIVDHGFRSVTALPYPLSLNRCSLEELCHLPGIGKKRAKRLLLERPYSNWKEVAKALDYGFPIESIEKRCYL